MNPFKKKKQLPDPPPFVDKQDGFRPLKEILGERSKVETAAKKGDVEALHSMMMDGIFITEIALRHAENTDPKLAQRLKRYMGLPENEILPRI